MMSARNKLFGLLDNMAGTDLEAAAAARIVMRPKQWEKLLDDTRNVGIVNNRNLGEKIDYVLHFIDSIHEKKKKKYNSLSFSG